MKFIEEYWAYLMMIGFGLLIIYWALTGDGPPRAGRFLFSSPIAKFIFGIALLGYAGKEFYEQYKFNNPE